MSLPSGQMQADDAKNHYTAIVLGAGVSGMATAIQLKEKLSVKDVMVYEKSDEIGGTWNFNRYPGVGCDVPFSFYSFSFAPPKPPYSEWVGQADILKYLKDVQKQYSLNNIRFLTMATEARHSRADGLWHVTLTDLQTGQVRERTCSFLFSCQGVLTIPNDPHFDTAGFAGHVFHSAEWDKSVDLRDKNVVVVGNGCTAAQVIPNIIDQTKSVTQICRSTQCILPKREVPGWVEFGMKWVPGFHYLWRWFIFLYTEWGFLVSDVERGVDKRAELFDSAQAYMKRFAPEKYWSALTPDFDVSAKRRIVDDAYIPATASPKFTLLHGESIAKAEGHTVVTTSGREVRADVIVLCTGFKGSDMLAPMALYNSDGEELVARLKSNGVKMYRGTVASAFPNWFWIVGPNTATGHSSVIFTSECQITFALELIRPLLPKLVAAQAAGRPGPLVEVTKEAEDEYYAKLRAEMKKKVWERGDVKSWYVVQGGDGKPLCTALYPWSQIDFWWHTRKPVWNHFKITE